MASRVAALRSGIAENRSQAEEHQRQADAHTAEAVRMEAALALEEAKLARTAAFWAGGGSLLLGDGITDDTLLHVARFLAAPKDLLRLCLANKRFGIKIIPSGSGEGGAAAALEMLSLPEEAARRWVAGCSEQERGWVPRRGLESWLGLMHEVGVLRLPLAFGRAHGDVTLSENGALATRTAGGDYPDRAVASNAVMQSGRHFAQFTVVVDALGIMFGVIRPGFDVEGGADAFIVDGHCFYFTYDGRRCPGNNDWEGSQTAMVQGDRIGMLLDLDQGSMSIWKNGERLGVMQAEGLTGPLCWAASLAREGDSARIESAPIPPAAPPGGAP